MIRNHRSHSRQKGFTLTEILIATAIFTIIMIAALLIYDRSNKVFKSGVEASDIQQNTRVAFDRVVQDLRMAGFDFDRDGTPSGAVGTVWRPATMYNVGNLIVPTVPNGFSYRCSIAGITSGAGSEPVWSTTVGGLTSDGGAEWQTQPGLNQYQQPDEQIEFAGRGAITLRANLNYETAAAPCGATPTGSCDNGREPAFEPVDGEYPVVTTANDEIVTYALKPDNVVGPDTISFFADTSRPRSAYLAQEAPVTIAGVDLCTTGCNNAPYTLYRITLSNDVATLARPVWTPLASNIRSLTFRYFEDPNANQVLQDLSATPVNIPFGNGGGGRYNPASGNALITEREIRKKIQSVRLELIGMNESPDGGYTNPTETTTSPFRSFRQYRLESLIVPRNYQKRGLKEFDTRPPGPPAITRVCVGACNIAFVEWQASIINAEQGAPDQYAVLYDTDDPTSGYSYQEIVGNRTSAFIQMRGAGNYYFKVQALNSFGFTSSIEYRQKSVINRTDTNAPSGLVAAADPAVASKINLTWTRPTTAIGSWDCTSGTPPATNPIPEGEIKGYNIYRHTSPTFTPPGQGTLMRAWNDGSPGGPLVDPASNTVIWSDRQAADCVNYYYQVQAVEGDCFGLPAANDGGNVGLALSAFSNEATGVQNLTAVPAAPTNLTLQASPASSCSPGPNCNVHLQWDRVTTDDVTPVGNPLTIVEYTLRRERRIRGIPGVNETRNFTVTHNGVSPLVTYTDNTGLATDPDGQEYVYYYTVAAQDCPASPRQGDFSTPPLIYPCEFGDGSDTYSITISEAPYDGNGTASAPYQVEDLTDFTVTTSAPLTEIRYRESVDIGGGVWSPVAGGSATTSPATFGFAGAGDGNLIRLDIQIEDNQGCTITRSIYVTDSPTSCCLMPFSFNPAVLTQTGPKILSMALDNRCLDSLTIQPNGIGVRWDVAGESGMNEIRFITPAGTDTITFATPDMSGALVFSPPIDPGEDIILGASNSYIIEFEFQNPLVTGTAAITDACITYERLSNPGLPDAPCKIVRDPSSGSCP